jgi:hypothetical protein
MRDRRSFIALGAGTGAAAVLAGIPGATAAQPPPTVPTCTQPWPNGTTGTAWTKPYGQQVLNRISAFDPSYNWTRLNNAYAAMEALPASDPRSLVSQQNVHAWYCATCGNGNDIHFSYTFFIWHRAFLYFHERILGQLVNDTTLRLPYWDWENASRQTMPTPYTQMASLKDSTRALQPGQSVQRYVPGWGVLNLVTAVPPMIGDAWATFGGQPGVAGEVEVGPHGYVHMSVGGNNGDMGNLELAAGDPIFYAHHSNIDRLWYSWEQFHTDSPSLSGIPPYLFYDGSAWRTMTAAQMIPATNIGYKYDTIVRPPAPFRINIPLKLLQNRTIGPPPPENGVIARAPAASILLQGVEIPSSGPTVVSVQSGGAAHELGTIFVVPHGKHAKAMTHKANVRFLVPGATAAAVAKPDARLTVRPTVANGRFLLQAPSPARLSGVTISVR